LTQVQAQQSLHRVRRLKEQRAELRAQRVKEQKAEQRAQRALQWANKLLAARRGVPLIA
jgi:hypothetical protein